MAIHIYMSREKGEIQPDGTVQVPPDAKMHYRGEAGPNDDPRSFAMRMAKLGHKVVLVSERHPGEQEGEKRQGRPRGGNWVHHMHLEGTA